MEEADAAQIVLLDPRSELEGEKGSGKLAFPGLSVPVADIDSGS